jgi:hypothetical protein
MALTWVACSYEEDVKDTDDPWDCDRYAGTWRVSCDSEPDAGVGAYSELCTVTVGPDKDFHGCTADVSGCSWQGSGSVGAPLKEGCTKYHELKWWSSKINWECGADVSPDGSGLVGCCATVYVGPSSDFCYLSGKREVPPADAGAQ